MCAAPGTIVPLLPTPFDTLLCWQVVRQMLPLPFLRVGHLLVVDDSSEQQPAVDERWQRAWFILDAESLRAAPDPQRQPAGA